MRKSRHAAASNPLLNKHSIKEYIESSFQKNVDLQHKENQLQKLKLVESILKQKRESKEKLVKL